MCFATSLRFARQGNELGLGELFKKLRNSKGQANAAESSAEHPDQQVQGEDMAEYHLNDPDGCVANGLAERTPGREKDGARHGTSFRHIRAEEANRPKVTYCIMSSRKPSSRGTMLGVCMGSTRPQRWGSDLGMTLSFVASVTCVTRCCGVQGIYSEKISVFIVHCSRSAMLCTSPLGL